ncbi:HEAT repeat domain-containing protein [Verrucomicrobia bacterium]|nr:HEAT repeat domain-containing protein [Verrucomicrobiota bacterium]
MNTKEILKAFPQPDGKILRTINKEACEKAVEQIIAGGKKTIREIVDLVVEPGKGEDIQPRHALHATAIRVGGAGKAKERKSFSANLADTLADDRPKAVKGFIIRQLQICAGAQQADAIAPFLNEPDEHLYEYAAQALEAIGTETVSHFRKAYPKAKGAPRLTILQGLGVLRDSESKDAFRDATKDKDLEIRLAGLWGLMRIASGEDVDLVLSQSAKESGWGRIKATAYCLELAENLEAKGSKKGAQAIYLNIKKTRTAKNEDHLLESADRGLARLK